MAREYDFNFGVDARKDAQLFKGSAYQILVMVAVVVLIAVTSFLFGVVFERRSQAANAEQFSTLGEVWNIIDDNYYGELPTEEERTIGTIQGLVGSLNDPFTTFAPPEQATVQRQSIDGFFGGIGVEINVNDLGQIFITRIIPGNPAERAGLLAGDVFMEVEGQPAVGWSTQQLSEVVRGEVGTDVRLTMYRESEDETFEVTIRRAIIEEPTVFADVLGEVGYIRLSSFNSVAATQMETNLDSLRDQGVQALVLDLRSNGGGLLQQAVDISDMFLDEGIILTERSNTSEETFRSDDETLVGDIPMLILVDGGTASASEVVAGALQDRDRALLVGTQTFGKGVVQLVYDLTDGSQLRVTAAAWYTPDGTAIHQRGLAPDLPVDPTQFGFDVPDPTLQTALDYLAETYALEVENDEERGD